MSASALPEGASVWVPAVLIAIGMVGIVVPVLPGLVLIVGAVLLWAVDEGGGVAWGAFALSVVLFVVGTVTQYLIPGRRMRASGVGSGTLALAVVLGIIGFFVIPVLGGPIGFVLGIYVVELSRTGAAGAAWSATKSALRAVLHSMGIELLTGLAITVVWVWGVLLSG
jgi:uncharacterized protein YqgC (DUF456 family)